MNRKVILTIWCTFWLTGSFAFIGRSYSGGTFGWKHVLVDAFQIFVSAFLGYLVGKKEGIREKWRE